MTKIYKHNLYDDIFYYEHDHGDFEQLPGKYRAYIKNSYNLICKLLREWDKPYENLYYDIDSHRVIYIRNNLHHLFQHYNEIGSLYTPLIEVACEPLNSDLSISVIFIPCMIKNSNKKYGDKIKFEDEYVYFNIYKKKSMNKIQNRIYNKIVSHTDKILSSNTIRYPPNDKLPTPYNLLRKKIYSLKILTPDRFIDYNKYGEISDNILYNLIYDVNKTLTNMHDKIKIIKENDNPDEFNHFNKCINELDNKLKHMQGINNG